MYTQPVGHGPCLAQFVLFDHVTDHFGYNCIAWYKKIVNTVLRNTVEPLYTGYSGASLYEIQWSLSIRDTVPPLSIRDTVEPLNTGYSAASLYTGYSGASLYRIQWSLSIRDTVEPLNTGYSGASLYGIQWSLSIRDTVEPLYTGYSGASQYGIQWSLSIRDTVEPLYTGYSRASLYGIQWSLPIRDTVEPPYTGYSGASLYGIQWSLSILDTVEPLYTGYSGAILYRHFGNSKPIDFTEVSAIQRSFYVYNNPLGPIRAVCYRDQGFCCILGVGDCFKRSHFMHIHGHKFTHQIQCKTMSPHLYYCYHAHHLQWNLRPLVDPPK